MLYYLSIEVASYAEEARQSSACTREILLALKQLPEPVRYGDENSFTLINAFGTPVKFPLELCFSRDVRDLCITLHWSVLTSKDRNHTIL
jgi:hypothetical protein